MGHILDTTFLSKAWATEELSAFFSDEQRFQRWLDIEAALALTEGELGVIPEDAAQAIARNARFDLLDAKAIAGAYTETGHTLVPVLRALEQQCPAGTGEFIHYGATTQDIIDTGLVLEMRAVWRLALRGCLRLEADLLALCRRYRLTPMVGRTHSQQALPITAGLKFASFAAELRRDIERLKAFPGRGFVIMLNGAVGTLAGFGPQALAIRAGVAKRLKLEVPPVCWANARDTVVEFQMLLGVLAGTLMRMANEICVLGHNEIGEFLEPLAPGNVGSSTMPHKRNPQRSSMVVAMGQIVQSNVQLAFQSQRIEHERDPREWRLDFHSVPESSILIGKMLENMHFVFQNLHVKEEALHRNLELLGGMLLSERLMFAFGKTIGKQTAHHAIHRAVAECQGDPSRFRECVLRQPEIAGKADAAQLDELTRGSGYLGFAGEEVDRAIAYCAACAATDDAILATFSPES